MLGGEGREGRAGCDGAGEGAVGAGGGGWRDLVGLQCFDHFAGGAEHLRRSRAVGNVGGL